MAVLEAAGYDVVLVETVGVGQSEITVAGMVDTFLFLTLARTGDQLQGIKKGILEIADVIAVNKADGTGRARPASAARELAGALRMVRGRGEWAPPVVTCSGLTGDGVDDVWEQVLAHRDHLGEDGLAAKRAEQQLDFTWALVRDELADRLRRSPGVAAVRDDVRRRLLAGDLNASVAADLILEAYDGQSGRVTPAPNKCLVLGVWRDAGIRVQTVDRSSNGFNVHLGGIHCVVTVITLLHRGGPRHAGHHHARERRAHRRPTWSRP